MFKSWSDQLKMDVLLCLAVAFAVLSAVEYIHFQGKIGAMQSQITDLAQTNQQLSEDNGTLRGNTVTLTMAVAQQNKAIERLESAGTEAAKVAAMEIEKARLKADKWKGQYDALFNAPKPLGTSCEALAVKIDQYFELRKREVAE